MDEFQVSEISGCNRHHAISILFANDPQLLDFFFSSCRQRLSFRTAARTLRIARRYLDRQQVLLVQIALAIWEEKGRISFVNAYKGLNDQSFETFLQALSLLHRAEGCQCPDCFQRHLTWSNESRVTVDPH